MTVSSLDSVGVADSGVECPRSAFDEGVVGEGVDFVRSNHIDRVLVDRVLVDRVLGIVLAGTHEWGACALERVTPRPLVPILNKPLVSHALYWLHGAGVQSAAICANGQTGFLRRELSRISMDGLSVGYVEDRAPRGPAGCIKDAGEASECDLFVVLEGTVVPQIDLSHALERHVQSGAVMTMVVANERTGGGTGARPAGIYIISREAFDFIPSKGYCDLKEGLLPALYAAGKCVMTLATNMEAPRVTAAEDYLGVNDWMLQHAMSDSADFSEYRRVGESLIHPTASVDESAVLMGPVLVGPGTTIGRGVTVVGPTSVGAGCEIRAGAVITRSSIWDDCLVEMGAVLDRCIMAHGAKADQEGTYRRVVFSESKGKAENGGGLLRRWMGRLGGRLAAH